MKGKYLFINNLLRYQTFKPYKGKTFSINRLLIEYLLQNSNREVTLDELVMAKVLKYEEEKNLKRCLRDIKFHNQWADVFFKVSNNSIMLINPVTQDSIDERGIEFIDFNKIVRDSQRQSPKKKKS